MMGKVGFSQKMMGDPVTTLSGGWRMKLALSRAMLQNADILLMALRQRLLRTFNILERRAGRVDGVTSACAARERVLSSSRRRDAVDATRETV